LMGPSTRPAGRDRTPSVIQEHVLSPLRGLRKTT
jgi:hypothetical protein